ncbi:Uncharacterised protein [Mycobacteroides abscessus subsp. abscessus]|nr:Uncharacterised protein [Mycobacteroides abscessus subsp. abscessus]
MREKGWRSSLVIRVSTASANRRITSDSAV